MKRVSLDSLPAAEVPTVFDISFPELLVLAAAALFILGPERLPGAAAWVGRTIRQVRDYATGAREQLRSQMGPEFEQLRQPLEDLRSLRDLDPRRAVGWNLLNEIEGVANDVKPNGYPLPPPATPAPTRSTLQPGERPPFDPDAT
jgi:sec-independent protein translocase protein TatB